MNQHIKGSLLILVATFLLTNFSDWPTYQFNGKDKSALIVSIRHITEKDSHCTPEEKKAFLDAMKKNRPHMNRPGRECGSRKRVNLVFTQQIDGSAPISQSIKPSGIHNDGAVYFHERFLLTPGVHKIVVSLHDDVKEGGFSYTFDQDIKFAPLQVVNLDLEAPEKTFAMR